MKINNSIVKSLVVVVITVVFTLPSSPLWGERGGHRDHDRRSKTFRDRHGSSYVFDRRHHHNRYYPRHGRSFRRLPRNYHVFRHRDRKFFFNAGVWYRSSGSQFVVVRPPIGLAVPFLPSVYTTVWVGSIPYYYAGGVYYAWQPERRIYVVTEPPREEEVREEPAVPEKIFIYPKEEQDEEQQARDRYECHSWSVTQTGFDPTQPGGNVPFEEYNERQVDYRRAMEACLEARDYSVK